MIQLATVMWALAFFFAINGWSRGWNKELISTAGIILGLFALFQFDGTLRGQLLAQSGAATTFFVQSLIFVVIVFFAYQTRALIGDDASRRRGNNDGGRDSLQESVLGAVLGFVNGWLIWGSLWYFMDINRYPLPDIVQPAAGSISEQTRQLLPLVLLGGGVGGPGDLLAVAVIVLFLIVLIMI
jgi:hypothetical protein